MSILPPNAPTAMPGSGRGIISPNAVKQSHIGQVVMEYRGAHTRPGMSSMRFECEIYQADGHLDVHVACPKCHHMSFVRGDRKAIEWDPKKGTLKIEPFKCCWEMDDERKEFGMSLCGYECSYEGREIKDR